MAACALGDGGELLFQRGIRETPIRNLELSAHLHSVRNVSCTAAALTVVSPSLITTTVPTGASTGKVKAVTPGGTLVSNPAFRVMP